jgi:hypothetical protein
VVGVPPTSDDNTGHGERGTASVELVAAVPFLLLALAVAAQIALAGQALWSASVAARAGARAALVGADPKAAARRAGALALAEGGSAADAARESLPGWADDNVSVAVEGEEVIVHLRPPSPFGTIADHLAVTSTASARSAE